MCVFRMARTEGKSVDNGAHPSAHLRSAGETTPPGSCNTCVKCSGSQLDIKSYRFIFPKSDDRFFTKGHRDIKLSPARRFLFCRFYVGDYILRNFIPDVEENIIGTALTGNKPIPFFFVEVNNFSQERFLARRDHPRGSGDPLEALQMSYVLFEIEKLKREIARQTQNNNPPLTILTVEDQRQECSIY